MKNLNEDFIINGCIESGAAIVIALQSSGKTRIDYQAIEPETITSEEIEGLIAELEKFKRFVAQLEKQRSLSAAEKVIKEINELCDRWSD